MKLRNMILGILTCAVAGSCAGPENGFTASEKEKIGSARGEPMRVLVIDDKEDSVLLRRPADRIGPGMFGSEPLSILMERMLRTVQDPENTGVGIAAPQVGISRWLITVQRFDKEGNPFEFYANPLLRGIGDKIVGPEGCLSIPGRRGEVARWHSVELTYDDPLTGDSRKENVEGFTAVIFQHEIDHLDGILYIDIAEQWCEE